VLQFLHRVLGLDHLHYGIWERDDPRTLVGLRRAQERYAQRLIGLVPPEVSSVLDVGAGVGTTALRLLERGVEVEGLSPDPYQKQVFELRVGKPFHLGRFQELEPGAPYDLVLMSESAQYIWLDSLFPAVLRTAPGGWLLVADYFVLERDGSNLSRSGHLLGEFLERAGHHGLELEHREDVTQQVLPTLELGRAWATRYADPTLELLAETSRQRWPLLHRLARRLLRRPHERYLHALELLDPQAFERCKRYEILRFRVP
jgi:SAM-dependent methyltransferase